MYLGKSVSAAQRWERELGLPVRRLKTSGGQVISASRSEIDAWRRQAELHWSAAQPQREARTKRRRFGRTTILAALLLIAAVTVFALRTRSSAASTATTNYLSGSVLAARDTGGRVLWEYRFDPGVFAPDSEGSRPALTSHLLEADIDGDGSREILALMSVGTGRDRASDRVYCFDERGAIRWVYDTAMTLRFRAGAYDPPDTVKAWAVSEPRMGQRQRLWLAVAHMVWWPGVVVELGPNGHATTIFVQSGQINALLPLETAAGVRVIAGGINNEYRAGVLALLNPGVAAHSPQTEGSDFECTGCPNGLPDRYIVIPPSDVTAPSRTPYNQIVDLLQADDRIIATSAETRGGGESILYYTDRALSSISSKPSDGFWSAHESLQTSGLLHHGAAACPEKRSRAFRAADSAGIWKTLWTGE